jgi:hypothetical protein
VSSALIVFAKYPEPGRVKTRLTPALTPDEAASLYRAFLLDALDQYTALPADIRLYLGPSESTPPLREGPPGVKQFVQQGAALGERMKRAFEETFAAGYQRAVIIGTDHPTLPTAFVRQAFDAIASPASLSIGPSTDGGYYLLGMNTFYPKLFEGMQYSHEDVLKDTLARATKTSAHITLLPPWYDVDRPEDVQRLVDDLRDRPNQAPRTQAALRRLAFTTPESDP